MKTNLVPGKADGEIRTAGSNKHNEPQQYCAYWCVAHARRMGGSVGTMGSVIICCVPRVRKTDTPGQQLADTYVQNMASRIETREIVLSTPAGKNVERLPRAPECTDGAETCTNVFGRASYVRALTVLPKSARAKRKVSKSSNFLQTYVYTLLIVYYFTCHPAMRSMMFNMDHSYVYFLIQVFPSERHERSV